MIHPSVEYLSIMYVYGIYYKQVRNYGRKKTRVGLKKQSSAALFFMHEVAAITNLFDA